MITDPLDAEEGPRDQELPDFTTALAALVDPDAPLQPGLINALSDPKAEEVDEFLRVWGATELERRLWIARHLVEAAEASFSVSFDRLFSLLLEDADPRIRTLAVEGLWENTSPKLVPRYIRLLRSDLDEDVRASAAAALGSYVYRGELEELDGELAANALSAVLDAAGDETEAVAVRRRAVESAGYADDPAVRALIEAQFEGSDRELRVASVCAMGRSADESWSDAVISTLGSEDAALCYEATLAAGKLTLEAAVPALIDLADSPDREIKVAAIWSLGEIGGRRARQALESLAESVTDDDLVEAVDDALAMAALSEGELPWGILGDLGE